MSNVRRSIFVYLLSNLLRTRLQECIRVTRFLLASRVVIKCASIARVYLTQIYSDEIADIPGRIVKNCMQSIVVSCEELLLV
jgi:hypothetical protein